MTIAMRHIGRFLPAHFIPAPKKIPTHVALIPNGTRTEVGIHDNPPDNACALLTEGYKLGAYRALDICECSDELGISHVSFFGFAIQNKKRPGWQQEALIEGATLFCDESMRRGYKLHPFGRIEEFKDDVRFVELYHRLHKIQSGRYVPTGKLTVHIAANYSGSPEYELGHLMDEVYFRSYYDVQKNPMDYVLSNGVPKLDLVIRTGGECRLSGMLPLQAAYAELKFKDISWMHYTRRHFLLDLHWFARQKRNHGA